MCYNHGMKTKTTESEVRTIKGSELSLPWLDEIASVYSSEALKMDWYVHPDAEVICCLKGEMRYEFDGHDEVLLMSGHALVIPPRTRHRLSCGIDAPSRRVSFKLNAPGRRNASEGLSPFTSADLRAIRAELLRRAFRPFRMSSDTIALLERLGGFLHGVGRLTVSARRETRVYISTLLVNCAGKAIEERDTSEPRMMEEATAWLEKHYAKKVSLRALVEHMGYGRTRFFELFRRKTGLSPNDYLIRLRIAKARELLADGRLSVKAVATMTGFSDPGFFSRTYKRLTGLKPTDRERS